MKKLISLILVFAMILGLTACSTQPEEAEKANAVAAEETQETAAETEPVVRSVLSEEIIQAEELGFAAEDMLEKLNETICFDAYCKILDALVESCTPDKMEQWKERSASFRDSSTEMVRIDGAHALLYAAECMGSDTLGFEYIANLEPLVPQGKSFVEGLYLGSEHLFPDRNKHYQPEAFYGTVWEFRCKMDYLKNAMYFVQQRSFATGKTYFDYDENYMMGFGEPFTYEAALSAAVRVYETSKFLVYIPADEVQCTISQEALTAGAAMPAASEQSLPDWRGMTVDSVHFSTPNYCGVYYQEEEIDVLSKMGFNFIRVPLDARHFFQGEDYTRVCRERLNALDQLIGMCAARGIHVCIAMYEMENYHTAGDISINDLFQNAQHQESFAALWRFFARYYRDVSPNLLSFNLLNEPRAPYTITENMYASAMLAAIDAIREEDPNRIIMADVLVYEGKPCRSLADSGVVQTWHPYLILGDGFETWPYAVINGFIGKRQGDFTLNGSFPAGTTIRINIERFHRSGSLELLADGQVVGSIGLGQEEIGEKGCFLVENPGTSQESHHYDGCIFECTLPEDASCLKLRVKGKSQYYYIFSLLVDTQTQQYEVVRCRPVVMKATSVPNLTLNEDGSISDGGAGTAVMMSTEAIMEVFEDMVKFREETGVQIMAQEFGFERRTTLTAAKGTCDALLAALDALNIPWCSWNGESCPLLDEREVALWLSRGDTPLYRIGSTYTPVSEHWVVDEALMAVYQKYMVP